MKKNVVPALRNPTSAPAATASDPPITVQVQRQDWRRSTCKPASFLITISVSLRTYCSTSLTLRYCRPCRTTHSRWTLCFPPTAMDHHHLTTLIELLDGTLDFTWKNLNHFCVFSLCRYFLFDEAYILPMFKRALRFQYALFPDDHQFFLFIFEMREANFPALATFHIEWLAIHNPSLGLSNDLLSIIDTTHSYDSFYRLIRRRCEEAAGDYNRPTPHFFYTTRDLCFFPP